MPAVAHEEIRRRRQAAGLTRERLAVAIGRSFPSVVSYESGHIQPPVAVLVRIAAELGCTVDDLLDHPARGAA